MVKVQLILLENNFNISTSNIISNKLIDILNKLSIQGRCIVVPTDRNPELDWVWEFRIEMLPAVEQILNKSDVLL